MRRAYMCRLIHPRRGTLLPCEQSCFSQLDGDEKRGPVLSIAQVNRQQCQGDSSLAPCSWP